MLLESDTIHPLCIEAIILTVFILFSYALHVNGYTYAPLYILFLYNLYATCKVALCILYKMNAIKYDMSSLERHLSKTVVELEKIKRQIPSG